MIAFKAVSFGYRLEALTAVSCVLLAFSSRWYPGLAWLLLIVAGLFSSTLLSRSTCGDPVLGKVVVASYLTRVFLTLGLFISSAWHLPIFRDLQSGDGFWRFAADSEGYHEFALRTLIAWGAGIDLHPIFEHNTPNYEDLSLLIALVYKALGASPLHFMLINAWLGSLTAMPSYMIAKRLGDGQAARTAAVLVAFWPSSILWSTQVLKDTVVFLLILVALLLVIALWQDSSHIPRRDRRIANTLRWLALIIVVMTLARFRLYMSFVLFTSVGVAIGIAAGVALIGRRWQSALNALGLIIVVGGAALVGQSVDPVELFSFSNLKVGHAKERKIAQEFLDLMRELKKAPEPIETPKPEPAEAPKPPGLVEKRDRDRLLHLSGVLAEHGNKKEAAELLERYLGLETNPEKGKIVREYLARTRDLAEELKRASEPIETPKPEPAEAPKPPGPVRLFDILPTRVQSLVKTFSIQNINYYRSGMIGKGGHSLVDSTVTFSNFGDALAYLPRGLAVAFFAPFPWQWFETGGETGSFRSFSAIEASLMYLLVPAIISSCWILIRRHRAEGWFLLGFVALTASLLSLTVANFGIFFRLRLQFLLPLLIGIGIGGLPDPYRRLLGFLRWKLTDRSCGLV